MRNRESDRELTKACTVAASLEGYETQTVNVAGFAGKSGGNLGTLVLKPMAASTTGLSSSSDAQVTAGQRKALQKSIDKAAKQDWDGAIKDLQQLTSAAPAYASAWLTLGMCLQIRGDREQAENSFLRAIRADPKFAPPLIRVATIEAAKGELQAAITHSQLAIEINPRAFPDAYWVNAVAEITLGNVDAAEKSARQGLAIDPSHHFPELDYTLGMVLYTKDERPEARKELRAYLDEAPGGPNAAGARNDLAAMDRADHAEPTSSGAQFAEAKPSAEERGAATGSQVSSALPANGSLEEHNAPLLKNGSSYTCLETATPVKIDARGRPVTSDTVRLDVGVSEGKEIYGIAAGKLFSKDEKGLLGYSFSTTGLFYSLARALVSGTQFAIERSGGVKSGEEILDRYNYRSLPNTRGWTITDGKQSGVANEAGWFLVDPKSETLRTAFVTATDIPSNLRLNGLSALVEYAPQTIAGHRVLLPTLAKVEADQRSGEKHLSFMSFDHCRAFTAESTVAFDDAGASASNQSSKPAALPSDTEILVALASPLSIVDAEADDVVKASIVKPVKQNGRTVVDAGAAVEGHVRIIRGDNRLVLELDRVLTERGWAPFYAQLMRLGSNEARIQNYDRPERASLVASELDTTLTQPDVPGVATLVLASPEAKLSTGTQMVWRTESLQPVRQNVQAPELSTSVGLH